MGKEEEKEEEEKEEEGEGPRRARESYWFSGRQGGLRAVCGEKASAYELREKGEATGEGRVVLGKITTDVATDQYEKTGYVPIDDLDWDEKAALGALLCNLAADEGVNVLNKLVPPFPPGESVNDARPTSAEAIRILQELDGEVWPQNGSGVR